ncbi:MAG: PBP1A family penicillin-binding protein [Myxococcota bacterium]
MAGLFVLGGLAGSVAFYFAFLADLPDPRSIADYEPKLASTVYSTDGEPIGEFFKERRRLVEYEEIPKHVVDAFVAAEDADFFEHQGIDFRGILRAAWRNFQAGGTVEGASTITQQMVKSLLLTPERSYRRKVREMILARRIEQRFTKQEILYLYLNQIYFGNGAYGIGEAARSYFDKDVSELTISEGAQLAGLPKAPSRYSPFRNPDLAERRRLYALGRMQKEGMITAAQHTEFSSKRPDFIDGSKVEAFDTAAYFTEEVRRFLFDHLGGTAVLEGGLQIETTLDLGNQAAAVAAVQKGLEALDQRNGYRGALRKVEPDAIEDELPKLAKENGLVRREEAKARPDEFPGFEELAEAEIEAGVEYDPLAVLAERQYWLGVVTKVDGKEKRATVALGADVEGSVFLSDVDWARPMNPDIRPYKMRKIEKILSVGDIARFERAPTDKALDGVEGAELRLNLYQEPNVQGALISIDVDSNDILAIVGGYDFARSQFNRATQSRRQPGSAFKPLVYGAALSMSDGSGRPRYTPASIIHDRPKVYRDRRSGFVWKPKNYGREFYGPITLRTALAKSVNNAAVHLCDQVGVGNVIRYAEKMGIHSPLEASLGIALGTSGVSLLELTRSYAVFPNGGMRVVPRFLRRVLDREGNVLLDNVPLGDPLLEETEDVAAGQPGDANGDGSEAGFDTNGAADPIDEDRLLPASQAYLMADMLRAVVIEGTGQRARALGRPLGGKTGTTNDQADAWFVGFSPEIATGVWVGFDETRFLGAGETGSRAALPVWTDYMRDALQKLPKRDFEVPRESGIVWARIDRQTGLLATRETERVVFQPFIAGTEPTRTAAAAQQQNRARQDLREDSFGSDAFPMTEPDAF